MHHHDDRRDREPHEGTEDTPPRERPTDRDWNAAGGDPNASSVLGGTASHQRASFNDPATGNADPIIGTSGLAAQEIAGIQSSVSPAGSSDEAAERARRRGSAAETSDQS